MLSKNGVLLTPTRGDGSSGATHLPVLDGIRALAAFGVVWFHFFQNPSNVSGTVISGAILRTASLGQTGVDLFFVLSGFLITRILLVQRERSNYFRNFYARRSLRILPLYYSFLIFSVFLQPVLLGQPIQPISKHWYWWVFLQNLPPTFQWSAEGPLHYWSLAVEEHFYLVWPLVVFCCSPRRLQAIAVFLIVFAFVTRALMVSYGYEVFYFTFARVDSMAMGALLAINERRISESSSGSRRFFRVVLVFALTLAAPLFFLFSGTSSAVIQVLKYSLIAFVYTTFLGLAITWDRRSVCHSLLTMSPIRWFGSVSFGVYVYHGVCFEVAFAAIPPSHLFARFLIGSCLSVLAAAVSYYLIEAPVLSLKKYFQ